MRNSLLIFLFPLLLSAQDTASYKFLHFDRGNSYMVMIEYDADVEKRIEPFDFSIYDKELNIEPSATYYPEAEKFIPKYHTETFIKDIKESDGILYGIRFGLLIIATLFYFYGLKNITIFKPENELRQ
jgi:hypothetical protein